MQFPTEVFGDVAVVHTPEELGEEAGTRLQAYLRGHERRKIILDLDGVESIDSVGLSLLLDTLDDIRAKGGDLKLYTQNVVNRKVLEITRLDQQLEVYESVIDAVKSYS